MVHIVRYTWPDMPTRTSKYQFLEKLDVGYPVLGKVGQFFDVFVFIELDDESRLGDDDAIGWFTDNYEPGCVKITAFPQLLKLRDQ